jgi:hypothetical protein
MEAAQIIITGIRDGSTIVDYTVPADDENEAQTYQADVIAPATTALLEIAISSTVLSATAIIEATTPPPSPRPTSGPTPAPTAGPSPSTVPTGQTAAIVAVSCVAGAIVGGVGASVLV